MALSDDLVGFVKQGLEQGVPRGQIEDVLLRAGWPPEQVRQALAGFVEVDFPIPVPRPRPSVSSRDAFLYVVMFATLVFSAVALGNLLFHLIDRAFPDPAAPAFRVPTLEAIRWWLASLIVAFPIFLFVARVVEREVRAQPIKRASKIRRQLTYLTLFIASCFLVGDFITAVYYFLGGELSVRFVLKVLTVAGIAGGIFGYYRRDLRTGEREPET